MYSFPVADFVPNLACAVMSELSKMITDQVPELKPDVPSFGQCKFSIGTYDNLCIATFIFTETGILTGGKMKSDEFSRLQSLIGDFRRYSDLKRITELSDYYSWDRLLIAIDVENECVEWDTIVGDLIEWANAEPLFRASDINRKRVRSALPNPPQYSMDDIQASLWILECDEAQVQGTAFDLENYGTITNEHVVRFAKNLRAFRADNITKTYSVRIEKKNEALDLAITKIVDAPINKSLLVAKQNISQMDHIAVCGFPNYKKGDSGIRSPGIVVGTRNVSGVTRLLTNAGIVSGMSGGPVVIDGYFVIGVCVTGANYMQGTKDTEDQAIIPISALQLLE